MDAQTLEPSVKEGSIDMGRLRDIVLVRIATTAGEFARAELIRDLGPLVLHRVSAVDWRHALDRTLAALADAGLVALKTLTVAATDAGRKRAGMVIGGRGQLPKTWREARDVRLVAKALGLEGETPARLKLLLRPDGLRMAIVQSAFAIKLRGVATASRLRSALAGIALDRAFSGPGAAKPAKTGLSAKDGRALAGQFSRIQRDYGTDARLITALAAEQCGAETVDLATLQTAILRRYVAKGAPAAAAPAVRAKKKTDSRPRRAMSLARRNGALRGSGKPGPGQLNFELGEPLPARDADKPAPILTTMRPDMQRFAAAVRAEAEPLAEGWVGNRKAYISRVWRAIETLHPEWGLSEIEFKAMLTEAHRQGHLILANADLKDNKSLRDVQASQIAYKNAVFHYIRVDE